MIILYSESILIYIPSYPSKKLTKSNNKAFSFHGQSKDPVLLTDTNCHFDIEWQTEYACEVDMYTSNGDCRFTYDNDGIDIDLRPLKGETPTKRAQNFMTFF